MSLFDLSIEILCKTWRFLAIKLLFIVIYFSIDFVTHHVKFMCRLSFAKNSTHQKQRRHHCYKIRSARMKLRVNKKKKGRIQNEIYPFLPQPYTRHGIYFLSASIHSI